MAVVQSSSQRSSSSSSSSCVDISHNLVLRVLIVLLIMTLLVNVIIIIPLEHHVIGDASPQSAFDGRSNVKDFMSTSDKTPVITFPKLNEAQGREYILSVFKEANVTLEQETMELLPTWRQVQEVVGEHPYMVGLDKCATYRDTVPAVERMLGAAGMFNSGTNLVTHLLKQNCQIPERREKYGPKATREQWGMRWQVPWGKHTPAKYRLAHATKKAAEINKEWVLPIVTIRNPYTWFKSMCKNSYTAKWDHGKINNCPMLVKNDGSANPVSTRFADKNQEETHDSIAHLWNNWYHDYTVKADYPFLVVRMEDLVFYAKETTTAICECAGGKIRTDQPFSYVVESAKADSRGHDHSTGIVQAWIKYSRPYEPQAGFTDVDYEKSKEFLDSNLMEALGYKHPPAGTVR